MNNRLTMYCAVLLVLITFCPAARAETGYEAWLRYAALTDAARSQYGSLPETVTVLGDSPLLASAQSELVRGIEGMLRRRTTPSTGIPKRPAIVLGTLADLNKLGAALNAPVALNNDGYWLTTARIHGAPCIIITGLTDRGVLYGAFAWLSALAGTQNVDHLDHEKVRSCHSAGSISGTTSTAASSAVMAVAPSFSRTETSATTLPAPDIRSSARLGRH